LAVALQCEPLPGCNWQRKLSQECSTSIHAHKKLLLHVDWTR